jgi:hypothetical protein
MTRLAFCLLLLLWAVPTAAQTVNPLVEVVLSSDQAQQGDTVYADVVIRNGQAVAGADIGIAVDSCLRVVDRQPGSYLPSTSETGGFSPFAELTDSGTRFAASITDRARVANGDGPFYRATLRVTCEEANPQVFITFAEIAALADPKGTSNDLLGYNLERGNLSIVNDALAIQPGAVAATPVPIQGYAVPPPETSNSLLLWIALGMVALSIAGLIILLLVYRRQQRKRIRPRI